MKHCCHNMECYACENNSLLKYSAYSREYNFILYDDPYGTLQNMDYCPWCGTKLPKTLGQEWCDAILEELGIEDVDAEEWARLPEKYKTEQWWRERGL